MSSPSRHRIEGVAHDDRVVADDYVVAVAAGDRVCAEAADQHVGADAAGDRVVALAAERGQAILRARDGDDLRQGEVERRHEDDLDRLRRAHGEVVVAGVAVDG
jgi:hypothetical protein